MPVTNCSHCGASPQKCAKKADDAVQHRKTEQAPDLTPQQARDDLTRTARMNTCCANCQHIA